MDLNKIIKVPYTTRPSMFKNIDIVFNNDPDSLYISNKKKQLILFGSDLYGETTESISEKLVRRVSTYLGKPVTDDIVDLALNFEEDIAIINKGVISAICFCFPSSWHPAKGIGKSLVQIHEPVADGEHLKKMSEKITKTITDPLLGSFRRYVWTVTNIPSLSNFYLINDYYKNEKIDIKTLYFRTETQTTLPLPDGNTAIFFVKVNVLPLLQVWPKYKDIIISSLNSMSESILEYKNLTEIKDYLKNLRLG